MRQLFALLAGLASACFVTAATAAPPIEAYGELPEIRALDFSPDGARFAFFLRKEGRDLMVVFENGKGNIGAIDVTDVKPRSLNFVSNKYVIVTASQTTKQFGGYEDGQSSSFNVETGELMALAAKEKSFRFYPTTAGGSMTPTDDPDIVYFAAFVGQRGDYPDYSLLRGNLKTGRAAVVEKGSPHTYNWIITRDGTIIAREDYIDDAKLYQLYTYKNGGRELIYQETNNEGAPMAIVGYTSDKSALIAAVDYVDASHQTLHRLSFDGKLSSPIYGTDARELGGIYVDRWDQVVGVRYAGMKPSYMFLDSSITIAVNDLAANYPNDSVTLTDWTDDFSKLVFSISGGATAPAYFLYDRATAGMSKLTQQYLQISDEDVAPVEMIEYAARDGLKIPSLLTHPRGSKAGDRLPAIILPHGGPEAYDFLRFDFWAQYFASRGYVVLQPNFRGSEGFGTAHRKAGRGEWGKKMQDDLTDGVAYLDKTGWIDPDRVCIMGGSYGGYAALAGGAFTPDVYKCVVALAPVADIPAFLAERIRRYGRYSTTLNYWEKLLGERKNNKEALEAISPVNAADAFKAPVLLLHGNNDTVVPYNQSTKMENALKAAGKDVTFVKLTGEDHWLSTSETRLQALREMDRFIEKHLGPAQ